MTASIKEVADTRVGDTVTDEKRPTAEPLPDFKEAQAVVFAGFFPVDAAKFEDLRAAVGKLRQQHLRIPFPRRFFVGLQQAFDCLPGLSEFLQLELGVGRPVHRRIHVLFLCISGNVFAELLDCPGVLLVGNKIAAALELGVGGVVVSLRRKACRFVTLDLLRHGLAQETGPGYQQRSRKRERKNPAHGCAPVLHLVFHRLFFPHMFASV